jgi:hypothetical protein
LSFCTVHGGALYVVAANQIPKFTIFHRHVPPLSEF